jgi:GNAT superfamily N-acetyltransferase
MSVRVRRLDEVDRPLLDAFLLAHADTSLFLRSNLVAAGMIDEGRPLQATYAGAFEDDALVAVVAHCWNRSLLLQAPRYLADTARGAIALSGRRVQGAVGPWSQLCELRRVPDFAERVPSFVSEDHLYAVALVDLVRPAALDAPDVACRRSRDADVDLLVEWRIAYAAETLHATPGTPLHDEARTDMERHHALGTAFVLEHAGRPVSVSTFNAQLPDVVQIGGVFTPPVLRGHGYGRAVVAGSLLVAAAAGVARAVLFTGRDNVAAQRAYAAIGFRRIGDYGLVRF